MGNGYYLFGCGNLWGVVVLFFVFDIVGLDCVDVDEDEVVSVYVRCYCV